MATMIAAVAEVRPDPNPGPAESPATGPRFSAAPSVREIFQARVFEEPLVPVGGDPGAAENAALASALVAYSQRNGPDDFLSLTDFLEHYPRSPWRASLLADLGLEYYGTAHYSLALAAWREAWLLAKEATSAQGKAIADRAAGELAYLYARLGRMTELDGLLKSLEGRMFAGAATERIHGAREALWTMENRPEISFRCGPLALRGIRRSLKLSDDTDADIYDSASTREGFSLAQVADLSKKIGLNYQMAFREAGGAFVVPAVVHWRVGHYAALVRREGDRYLLEDPTFGNSVWASRAALEAETSGYFLLPPGLLSPGWRRVSTDEGAGISGKGVTNGSDPGPHGPGDHKTGGGPCKGLAVPGVHLMLVNLNLSDEPVGYSPPVGPAVRFTVRYNHRDAFQPANFTYSNFGAKWTCDWISYITDNPRSLSANVTYYIMGGGTRTFTGFKAATQSFDYEQYDQTLLTRTATGGYQMLWRDGTKLIFSQSDGATGTSRKVFLTQVMDPFGNTVTLNYDRNLRLATITDAIGQVTTLTYGQAEDPYKITKVTDPFGRYATFDYDFTNRLAKITDVIGLTSAFTYEGSGDFINSLITPYGTTRFTRGGTNTTRWLETLYPDGSRERVEYNQAANLAPFSVSAAELPRGMTTFNKYLYGRNTFYWSRNGCATAYGDYSKARIYHWLHTVNGASTAGILESTKEPLEGRVWYSYAGQPPPYYTVGDNNRPIRVGRILDDGSTQLYAYAYDDFGHVTQTIDPIGRTMSYIYSTNGVDLLEVRQTREGRNELLSITSYNEQHLPLAQTDAAGQVTTNTYNPRGQLLTTTNPLGETTTYFYDRNGYLVMVDGPLPGASDVLKATYDAFGRVRTKTDESGYTLTFDYDALDRIVKVTYPDATFSQYTYDRLDPVVIQDRAGRQTRVEYDRMRQMTTRTDPLNRVTLFQWCSCGDLSSLTDPMGRTTTWIKDAQGRLTGKQYGDGSLIRYVYERATSRVRQMIDERAQVTDYTYNRDNTLRAVAYPNAAVPTPGVSYTYDPDYPRLTSMTDGTGTTGYSYHPIASAPATGAGRLAKVDGPLPNDTITYIYDPLGRRISTAIDGVAATVGYDAAGRVMGETNALGAFGRAYDGPSSRVVAQSFPNGQTSERAYGSELEDWALRKITHRVDATPVSEFIYGCDLAADRITTWSQQAGTESPSIYRFGYDDANQLLSATVTNAGILVNSFAYAYDPAGNRVSERVGSTTNLTAYNALNQLSAGTGAGGSRIHEWDANNRLVAINAGTQRVEFAYDGLDRLASLRLLTNGAEASLRRLVWCGRRLCEERDARGTVTKRFFPQGMSVESGQFPGSFYYTRDHLDSVRELTDLSGKVRVRYHYDPYGRRAKVAGDIDADFGFSGIYWCAAAGLAATPFRFYDPELGRWLSRDPLKNAELEEGPNLYAYVGNDPVNTVDPLGLSCEKEQGDLVITKLFSARACHQANDIAAGICAEAKGQITDPVHLRMACAQAYAVALQSCLDSAKSVLQADKQLQQCRQKPSDAGKPCAGVLPSPPTPIPWPRWSPPPVNEVSVATGRHAERHAATGAAEHGGAWETGGP